MALLPTLLVGPGMLVARRGRGAADERLCVALAAGGLLLFLAAWTIHLLGLPRITSFGLTALSLVLAWIQRRELAGLLARRSARRLVVAWLLLATWVLLLLALVRVQSGGLWSYDDVEHWERTRFFLERLPADTRFLGRYALPARPPLMNVLVAHALAHAGADYSRFQVAMASLNLLIVLPALLLVRRLLWPWRFAPATAIALLLTSPALAQNATFPWTKLFAGSYALLGLYLIWRGRSSDTRRVVLGFAALATGMLVHYSVAPYAVTLGVLALLRWVRTRRWREALSAAGVSCAILVSFVGWSLWRYGVATTFGSNTTITETHGRTALQHLQVIVANALATLVPHPLWGGVFPGSDQASRLGWWRDYWFPIVQMGLPWACGLLGGVVLFGLVVCRLRGAARASRRFFVAVLAGSLALGIALHSNVSPFGSAHVCLLALIVLGTAFLGAALPHLPRGVRVIVGLGAALDLALGIALQFAVQRVPIAVQRAADGRWSAEHAFSAQTGANAVMQVRADLRLLGDRVADLAPAIGVALWVAALAALVVLFRASRRLPAVASPD